MRTFVKEHPGRYAIANAVAPTGPDDPLTAAIDRLLDSLAAVLRGFQLAPGQEIHALRMLRCMLHGFTTVEVTGGFRIETDVDDSFTWMIDLIGHRPADPAQHGVATAGSWRPGCARKVRRCRCVGALRSKRETRPNGWRSDMTTVDAPGSDIDLFTDSGHLRAARPVARTARHRPVVHLPAHDVYAIPRHAEAAEVLDDWQRYSSAQGVFMNTPLNEQLGGKIVLCPRPARPRRGSRTPVPPAQGGRDA